MFAIFIFYSKLKRFDGNPFGNAQCKSNLNDSKRIGPEHPLISDQSSNVFYNISKIRNSKDVKENRRILSRWYNFHFKNDKAYIIALKTKRKENNFNLLLHMVGFC
jgi:hypothetical protein